MINKALQQVCNLYQLKNFSHLVAIVSQLYKELNEESKLVIVEYLPKIIPDLNQRQLVQLIRSDVSASMNKNLWNKIFEILPYFDLEYLIFEDFLFIFDSLPSAFTLGTQEEVFFKFLLLICKTPVQFEIVWMKLKLYSKEQYLTKGLICLVVEKIVQNLSFLSLRTTTETHFMNSLYNVILIGLNKQGNSRLLEYNFLPEHLEYLFGAFNCCAELLPSSFVRNLLKFGEKGHNSIMLEALYCNNTEQIQMV